MALWWPKTGLFTPKVRISGFKSGFFGFLDPQNGGGVTFSALKSHSTPRNIDIMATAGRRDPKLKLSMRGFTGRKTQNVDSESGTYSIR